MELKQFDAEIREFLETWLDTHLHGSTALESAQREIVKGTAENPATQLDLELHRALRQFIQDKTQLPLVSEEDEPTEKVLQRSSPFWLIDPIDGSREFAKRIPECVSSIALIDPGSGLATYGILQDLFGKKAYSSLEFPQAKGKSERDSSVDHPILLWSRGEEKLGLVKYLEPLQSCIAGIGPTVQSRSNFSNAPWILAA